MLSNVTLYCRISLSTQETQLASFACHELAGPVTSSCELVCIVAGLLDDPDMAETQCVCVLYQNAEQLSFSTRKR
jgi:hypothetical protein